ncbi:MAG: hypothetical protein K2W82_04210 [Candidatus Obscuribacterales bacterium]|nr:hypothetical protein [Candidatus Obscuribacterales bacterium]
MFSYRELKKMVYIVETLLGVILYVVGATFMSARWHVFDWLLGVILCAVGIVSVLFGITTYFLRNDPDIWR